MSDLRRFANDDKFYLCQTNQAEVVIRVLGYDGRLFACNVHNITIWGFIRYCYVEMGNRVVIKYVTSCGEEREFSFFPGALFDFTKDGELMIVYQKVIYQFFFAPYNLVIETK